MRTIVRAMALVLLCVCAASADKIYLKDGRLLHARVTSEDEASYLVETGTTWERIAKSSVEKIVQEAGTEIPPAPGAPVPSVSSAGESSPGTVASPVVRQSEKAAALPVVRSSNEFRVRFGADMAGKQKSSSSWGTSTENTTTGFSAAGEYTRYVNANAGLGFGIAEQTPRKMQNFDGNFSFVPVYGIVRLRSTPSHDLYFYGTGHFGYNLFNGDVRYRRGGKLEGGIYTGIGTGLVWRSLFVELLYSVNRGTYQNTYYYYSYYGGSYAEEVRADIEYSKLSLSVGIAFP